MTRKQIDIQPRTVKQLLTHVEEGRFAVPKLQREFVWDGPKAAKLLDSIHARMPVTIVRPPIVFGPGDVGVLELFRPIASWGVHLVPGRGEHRISLIHVSDLVEGLIAALERGERMNGTGDEVGRGVYFMAGGESPAFAELGRLMSAALDRQSVRVVRVPRLVLRAAGRVGDVVSRVRSRRSWINSDKVAEALAGSWMCSAQKARDQLCWSPTACLDEQLRETAMWYREKGWL